MGPKQINQWAKNLTAEVDKVWFEHSFLESGYAVFYSPVIQEPEILIVGFNPGGDFNSFDQQKAILVPEQHEYLKENYAIAKKMRLLFESIEETNALEHSVKTNLLFFRSPSIAQWNKVDAKTRIKLEQFCANKVKEMTAMLRPRIILAEGIKTYTHLRILLSFESKERVIKSKSRTLVVSTRNAEHYLVGIIHPTGARTSSAEWDIIRSELKTCLTEAKK